MPILDGFRGIRRGQIRLVPILRGLAPARGTGFPARETTRGRVLPAAGYTENERDLRVLLRQVRKMPMRWPARSDSSTSQWSRLPRPALAVPAASRWDLAAAIIAIKMRWFGLVVGFTLANLPGRHALSPLYLNLMLGLGLAFATLDTAFTLRGRLFVLSRYPIMISLLEAIFICLLCLFDTGLESPFRYYYFLSLVTCAVRYPLPVPFVACVLHAISYAVLHQLVAEAAGRGLDVVLMIVMMFWVSWATASLALLLKRTSGELRRLNQELRDAQARLEERIVERTQALEEAQAQVVHQEKQATFGLLAAGIAHEVGNPLTSISGLVQMLLRTSHDPQVQQRLPLVVGELDRIQATLRDLVNFSRPTSALRAWVPLNDVVQETLQLAKYYKRISGRRVEADLPPESPVVWASRDQLTQALLNLVLNAIDATQPGGRITVSVRDAQGEACVEVRDDGAPVPEALVQKLFQPYFTTKPEGSGLGLFITRKLMEEHGGRVVYHPAAGAGGKSFRLLLPCQTGGTSEAARSVHGNVIAAAG